jgi:hypothetical protein
MLSCFWNFSADHSFSQNVLEVVGTTIALDPFWEEQSLSLHITKFTFLSTSINLYVSVALGLVPVHVGIYTWHMVAQIYAWSDRCLYTHSYIYRVRRLLGSILCSMESWNLKDVNCRSVRAMRKQTKSRKWYYCIWKLLFGPITRFYYWNGKKKMQRPGFGPCLDAQVGRPIRNTVATFVFYVKNCPKIN